MTTLHDRLAELADHVEAAPAAPPDLWRRGRRYGRRRAAATAATVVAVALVAALGAAGLAIRTSHPVEPAAPQGRTVLPDRFFAPSGRLPIAHDGIGPLVAVIPTQHFSWTFRGRMGLVGVSAVTQQYAFLDLPGWIGDVTLGDHTWSLSTNGRWLAYWYGDRAAASGQNPADGIAVLDTLTGKVRKHDFGAKLGVQPERVGWAGDTLWFTEWDFDELQENSASAKLTASYSWDLEQSDQPQAVDDPRHLLFDPMGPALTDAFLTTGHRYHWFVVPGGAGLPDVPLARIAVGELQPDAAALSPDGRTIAIGVLDQSATTTRVLTGAVAGEDTQVSTVPADLGSYPVVHGWLDDRTLAVEVSRRDGHWLRAVDVGTGEERTLATLDGSQQASTQYAADLLRSPVVHAVAPPAPVDPRKVLVCVGALVLLLGAGLRWWRRRAHR